MGACKVVGNEILTMPALTGGFTSGRKITFQMPDGTLGIVKVTDAQIDSGEWEKMIEAECAKLAKINALGQ